MDFEVNRQDFRDTRIVDAASAELAQGQIRVAVERFALTTNNVTYAVAGDMLDYWGFFPAETPWGRLPAMGLGSVVETANPQIPVGGRYFGFYPMSDQLVIAAEPHRNGFRDIGAHRANHADTYTSFIDVGSEQMFQDHRADEYLLLRGLFMTSFLADDYLGDNGFAGASQTLVTSASSKTSICLAVCLARRGHTSIGLTSARNRAFVESLDMYQQVITYDEIDQLDSSAASGMVDMAGNGSVRSAVHTHFGDELAFSLTVGATHWEEQAGTADDLPGPKPEFFFAPGQIAKRTQDWGGTELTARIARSWHDFVESTDRWMTVVHRSGPAEISAVYRELLEGQADPSIGYVVSMSQTLRETPLE
ncbi:MAG: DUF2855 family protein [Acidimicrobiaceae bacterium]|nr:DUF2855 family protein [Acidimicrobiaceae bacterium]